MRRFSLAALAAFTLVAPILARDQSVGPNTWTIDTNHSAAGFSVKHLMVSTVRGTLGPIKGTIQYDGKSVESIKVDVTIDVKGINTGNESRDGDLKTAEGLFEVAKFPTATFKSKRAVPDGAGKVKLVGDLTIHGVTKEVTLDVEGPSAPLKMGANLRIGASATTTINRREFGISYNRAVEATPMVADEIKVNIEVEATKSGG